MSKTLTAEQLAEKEARRLARKAQRVNDANPLHYLPYKSDRASADTRRFTNGYEPSKLPEGAVKKPSFSRLKDPENYRTGMGDTIVPERPGSMDYKKWPSRGLK